MISSRRSRSLYLAAAGLCHGSRHSAAVGFGISTSTRLLSARAAVCARGTRLGSTVEFERRSGVAETTQSLERLLDPETRLHEISADASAAATVVAAAEEPSTQRKKRRNAKDPEVVLEGDVLINTPKMVALVWTSLALNALYLLQACSTISSPLEGLWTMVGAFVGYMIADFVSGVFHWSVDNYGDGRTPVFGAVIEAFQGHHVSPWTITHRPFENNVHKIAYAVLPLLALLRLVDPDPAGVALGVTFLVGSLMSNEFHRFAHMTDPPALVKTLQYLGVTVSRKEHGRHHSSPFEGKYCIVNGICNGPLDHFRVFRFMERVVYQLNGAEPIAWKLDPSVKEEALSTGWLPVSGTVSGTEDVAA